MRRTATQPSFLVRALPPTLGWAVPYSPPSSESQYYPALACRLLRRFRDAAFEGAARNADATEQVSLDIPGTDTAHIALVYKDLIGQAVAAGDFSEILTRDRAFNVYVLFRLPVPFTDLFSLLVFMLPAMMAQTLCRSAMGLSVKCSQS